MLRPLSASPSIWLPRSRPNSCCIGLAAATAQSHSGLCLRPTAEQVEVREVSSPRLWDQEPPICKHKCIFPRLVAQITSTPSCRSGFRTSKHSNPCYSASPLLKAKEACDFDHLQKKWRSAKQHASTCGPPVLQHRDQCLKKPLESRFVFDATRLWDQEPPDPLAANLVSQRMATPWFLARILDVCQPTGNSLWHWDLTKGPKSRGQAATPPSETDPDAKGCRLPDGDASCQHL